MAKSKTIGGDAKRTNRHCAYCGEKFGWTEFSNYMFRVRSDEVLCEVCQETSIVDPSENKTYVAFRLCISWIIGLAIAAPAVFYLVRVIYIAFFSDGAFSISGSLTALLIVGGAMVGQFVNHILSWVDASFSKKDDMPMMQFIK